MKSDTFAFTSKCLVLPCYVITDIENTKTSNSLDILLKQINPLWLPSSFSWSALLQQTPAACVIWTEKWSDGDKIYLQIKAILNQSNVVPVLPHNYHLK